MIKKILKIVGIIALVFILLLTVMIVIGSVLQDERHMSPWGTGFFIIGSGSMEPEIPVGSIILIREVPEDKISVGDVLTFLASDWRTVVTHRVREVNVKDGVYFYTTRGDKNDTDDFPFRYERVIGRVAFVVPGSDFLVILLGNGHYLGIAVIVLGFILCFSAVVGAARKKSKEAKAAKKEQEEEKPVYEENTDEDEAVFDVVSWEADFNKDEANLEEKTQGEDEIDLKTLLEDENEIDLGTLLMDDGGMDLDTLLKDVDFDEIDFNGE